MQFSDEVLIRIVIFVLAVCGFMVAKHIRRHKTTGAILVCPIRFDCHTVVHSNYSRFFGIPVEILGMFYYGVIAIFYFLSAFMADTVPAAFMHFLTGVSMAAFLFSAYLIAVQIFILKKGCSWCIVSALISASIFILASI